MSKRTCDCCYKLRSDVKLVGRDFNGDPGAPAMCFLCRVEDKRCKVYDPRQDKYVYPANVDRS